MKPLNTLIISAVFLAAVTAHASLKRAIKNKVLTALPNRVLVVRGDSKSNKVSLTFDDGPDEMTPKYIELLDQLNVKATFFLLGNQIKKFPEYASLLAKHGHEVAGHGMTHKSFPVLSRKELNGELTELKTLLTNLTGANAKLIRPPHGATSPRSLLQSCLAGYSTALWSVVEDDTTPQKCDELVNAASAGKIKGGDVVLLHEGQQWTLDALPKLVNDLRACGLEIVPMSKL